MDSKHQSIAQTTSDRIMEATNTTTALCDNSLRVGQLVLCTSSLYDSLIFSTSFILSRFLSVSFSATKIRLRLLPKSDLEAMTCNSTEGRNRTHIDGFGDRSPTIGGLPFVGIDCAFGICLRKLGAPSIPPLKIVKLTFPDFRVQHQKLRLLDCAYRICLRKLGAT